MAPSKEYVSPFSIKGIKKTPSVVPIVGCTVLGVGMAAAYTVRLATTSPDVTWNTRKNNEPWQSYENKQYTFMKDEPFDVKNYKHPRPRF